MVKIPTNTDLEKSENTDQYRPIPTGKCENTDQYRQIPTNTDGRYKSEATQFFFAENDPKIPKIALFLLKCRFFCNQDHEM